MSFVFYGRVEYCVATANSTSFVYLNPNFVDLNPSLLQVLPYIYKSYFCIGLINSLALETEILVVFFCLNSCLFYFSPWYCSAVLRADSLAIQAKNLCIGIFFCSHSPTLWSASGESFPIWECTQMQEPVITTLY